MKQFFNYKTWHLYHIDKFFVIGTKVDSLFQILVLNISTHPEFLISSETMFHTLEAKYFSEFRQNSLVFTQLLAKMVCELKL